MLDSFSLKMIEVCDAKRPVPQTSITRLNNFHFPLPCIFMSCSAMNDRCILSGFSCGVSHKEVPASTDVFNEFVSISLTYPFIPRKRQRRDVCNGIVNHRVNSGFGFGIP